MPTGILVNLGAGSYLAIFIIAIIFIAIVGNEIYRCFKLKVDRGFWQGIGVSCWLIFFGFMFIEAMDSLEKHKVVSSFENENKTVSGLFDYDSLLKEFNIEHSNMCTVEDTEESIKCRFLMMFNASDERFVTFISSDTRSVIRFGKWPSSHEIDFPPFKVN